MFYFSDSFSQLDLQLVTPTSLRGSKNLFTAFSFYSFLFTSHFQAITKGI